MGTRRMPAARTMRTRGALVLTIAALTLMACNGDGDGETTETAAEPPTGEGLPTDHFAGETIEIVHGFTIGGGYDIYARLIATHLSEYLDAQVVVVHQPGAGGFLSTNRTWSADPDGTTITLVNASATIGAELGESDAVQYEAEEFAWIGRVSTEPNLAVTRAGNDAIASLEDLLDPAEPIRFAASGPGSVEYIDAIFLREVFDIPINLISGFDGGPEAFQSVLAGDTDVQIRTFESNYGPVEAGDADPLLLIGDEVPELPDTPTVFDIEGDIDQDVVRQHVALVEMGRGLIGPPGMDPEVLQLLRDAYEAIATNPDVVAEAEQEGRPLGFMSGAEQEDMVRELLSADESYVSVLRQAFATEG